MLIKQLIKETCLNKETKGITYSSSGWFFESVVNDSPSTTVINTNRSTRAGGRHWQYRREGHNASSNKEWKQRCSVSMVSKPDAIRRSPLPHSQGRVAISSSNSNQLKERKDTMAVITSGPWLVATVKVHPYMEPNDHPWPRRLERSFISGIQRTNE